MDNSLLEQAKSLLTISRKQYIAAHLQIGRLLRQHVQLRLSDGTLSRLCLYKEMASYLEVRSHTVHDLMRISVAVDLLSDGGDTGKLTWMALCAFRACVGRPPGDAARHGHKRDMSRTAKETWLVKDERFVGIFRQAASAGWNKDQVRLALGRRQTDGRCNRGRKDADEQKRSALHCLKGDVAAASPGDVAAMCLELVGAARDPAAVTLRLLVLLQRHREKPKRTG